MDNGPRWFMFLDHVWRGSSSDECLRMQEIDFGRNEILVCDGKGAKDQITMLPESVKTPLQGHLTKVKTVQQQDGGVSIFPTRSTGITPRAEGLAVAMGGSPREPLGTCQDRRGGTPSCP